MCQWLTQFRPLVKPQLWPSQPILLIIRFKLKSNLYTRCPPHLRNKTHKNSQAGIELPAFIYFLCIQSPIISLQLYFQRWNFILIKLESSNNLNLCACTTCGRVAFDQFVAKDLSRLKWVHLIFGNQQFAWSEWQFRTVDLIFVIWVDGGYEWSWHEELVARQLFSPLMQPWGGCMIFSRDIRESGIEPESTRYDMLEAAGCR